MNKTHSTKETYTKTFLTLIFSLALFCSHAIAQEFRTVKPGVEYSQIVRKGNGADVWRVNLLRIDLTKADIQVMRAMDEVVGLETTSSLAQRYGAIAAINAGFFRTSGTYRGEPSGALQIDGKLLSESSNNRAAVGFIRTKNHTEIIFGHLSFIGFVETSEKQKLDLNCVNCPRAENQLVLYTSEFHRTTLTDANGIEVTIKNNRVVSMNDRRGSSHIPDGGFVLSATGTARDWILKNMRIGTRLKIETKFIAVEEDSTFNIQDSKEQATNNKGQRTKDKGQTVKDKWQMAEDIVGGRPQIIRDGKIEINFEEGVREEFSATRHPRSAIAKLKDGRILLLTVDGRQPDFSVGMTLEELANLLLELGATEAINLDGGGSSTMVVENKVVNKPSDSAGERAVSDALLVFERKGQQKR